MAPQSSRDTNRWISFRLGDQLFALPVIQLRELVPLRNLPVTAIPHSPPAIEGTTLIRDLVVTVVDIRPLMGMPSMREDTQRVLEMLRQREQDHINWLNELEASVREQREFTLQTDPNLCKFGRWYNALMSDREALSEFTRDNLALLELLERFNLPHRRIHSIAQKVVALVEQGRVSEAQEIIDSTRATQLNAMLELFESCRQMFAELRRGILMIVDHDGDPLGVLVDVVNEVMTIRQEQIEELPRLADSTTVVTGLARCDGRLIQLLDVARIVEMLQQQEAVAAT